MSSTEVKRAAIYARISKSDPGVDKIENQISELRKLALASGYEVVATFTDDDISAYRGESVRPGYLGLINGLKDKLYDVVMATEPQRFTRASQTELDALLVQCIRSGAVVHTRSAGVQNPENPTTVALMQIMDVVGGLEVASRVERQRARNRADIEKGIPTKGLRPFGWEADRITIRESEAVVIRAAFTAILERGESISSIARKWNRSEVRTDVMKRPRRSRIDGEVRLPSGTWTPTTVRQILTRRRNAGILTFGKDEMPLSKIEPIVSREDYESLITAIKTTKTTSGPKPRYLLGGILECICGRSMHATTSHSRRPGGKAHRYKVYVCSQRLGNDSRHVSIQVKIADQVVRDWVVENIGLDLDDFPELSRDVLDEINSKMDALEAEEAETTEFLLSGLGNRSQIMAHLADLRAKLSKLQDEKSELISTASLNSALLEFQESMSRLPSNSPDADVDQVLEAGYKAWDSLPFDDKRAIIRGAYTVSVRSGGRGQDRVEVRSKNPKLPGKSKKRKSKSRVQQHNSAR
jgi:site-specific DNA recombinase